MPDQEKAFASIVCQQYSQLCLQKCDRTKCSLCSRCPLVLAPLLAVQLAAVRIPVVTCLANMSYENRTVAQEIANTTYRDIKVLYIIVFLVSRDKPVEMQLEAARCLTNLHRAGAVPAYDPIITFRTLPCLVRLCLVRHSIICLSHISYFLLGNYSVFHALILYNLNVVDAWLSKLTIGINFSRLFCVFVEIQLFLRVQNNRRYNFHYFLIAVESSYNEYTKWCHKIHCIKNLLSKFTSCR